MKKKLIGTILTLSCIMILATACGKTSSTSEIVPPKTGDTVEITKNSEIIKTNTNDEANLPTCEELSAAMQEQFNDMHNFTVKMYVSPKSNEYTENDLYMIMSDGDGVTYSYIANYMETYTIDNTVYYFDETQQKWFTDEYNVGSNTSIKEEADAIKNQVFPESTIIERDYLNETEYITATYIDTDDNQTKIVYYFTEDLKFVAASSEMSDAIEMSGVNASYLYMTLSTDGTTIPEDVQNVEKGNFEEYMTSVLSKIYETDSFTETTIEE